MTLDEAARILSDMHKNAPRDDKTLYDLLFGIMYNDELEGLSSSAIAKRAGIEIAPMVSLGRKLASYVTLKENNTA